MAALSWVHRSLCQPFCLAAWEAFCRDVGGILCLAGVVLHEVFLHSDVFFCMVCEVLGDSLYDFLSLGCGPCACSAADVLLCMIGTWLRKWNGYRGYWLQDIQAFAKQSLKGLSFLHNMSLTHTDLKPENILLRTRDSPRTAHFPRADFQPPSERYAKVSYARPASNDIKLIDFGNATYVDMHHSSVIQTRQYRSPEVILNMGWSEKADLWSLGCILFELYSGNMLFQTHSSPEHLALMETWSTGGGGAAKLTSPGGSLS